MRAQAGADVAKHLRVVVRSRIADRIGQVDDRRTGFDGSQNRLAEVIDFSTAGILGGKFHLIAVLFAEAHHFRNLIDGLLACGSQLVFQVQVGSSEEKVQARLCGRLETAQGSIYVVLYLKYKLRYGAMLDFSGHGSRGLQVSGGGNRETRFDDVHAELLDLPRKLQLFLAIHRKAGGLLAVSQRRVEDLNGFHSDSFHSDSEPRKAQGVQFIIVAR